MLLEEGKLIEVLDWSFSWIDAIKGLSSRSFEPPLLLGVVLTSLSPSMMRSQAHTPLIPTI